MDRNWLTQFNMALDLANAGNFREAEEMLANVTGESRNIPEKYRPEFILQHIITQDAMGKTAFARGNDDIGVSFMLKAAAIELTPCSTLEENPTLERIYSCHCGVLQNLCIAYAEMGDLKKSR